ncbi:hypothetical protein SUGI_1497880 [Cryptomeria japonica]|uniref:Uncharacterized protein n=1 Tax=Cryptomeria japonica TaxID=3369 RepID=A0AAD3NVM4_CRYJA|nr:hypothetical protein SUGI_1497880 [Cryptomeria japonica]
MSHSLGIQGPRKALSWERGTTNFESKDTTRTPNPPRQMQGQEHPFHIVLAVAGLTIDLIDSTIEPVALADSYISSPRSRCSRASSHGSISLSILRQQRDREEDSAVPYDDRDPPVTYEAREASEQANRVDPALLF